MDTSREYIDQKEIRPPIKQLCPNCQLLMKWPLLAMNSPIDPSEVTQVYWCADCGAVQIIEGKQRESGKQVLFKIPRFTAKPLDT